MLSDEERALDTKLGECRDAAMRMIEPGDGGDAATVVTLIVEAQRALLARSGRRDADNEVQAKYLEEQVATLEVAAGVVESAKLKEAR